MTVVAAEDIERAFHEGEPILFGWPARVRMAGGAMAMLDLAAAAAGPKHPPPYHTYQWLGPAIDFKGPTYRDVWIEGRRVGVGDVDLIEASVAAMPPESERHSEAGEQARLAAGEIALKIRDAHLRATMLTWCDGWAAIARNSELLDDSQTDGKLYAPPAGLLAKILVVTCPSTKRTYAHCVPAEHKTAAAARRWMMGLEANAPAPDVET